MVFVAKFVPSMLGEGRGLDAFKIYTALGIDPAGPFPEYTLSNVHVQKLRTTWQLLDAYIAW